MSNNKYELKYECQASVYFNKNEEAIVVLKGVPQTFALKSNETIPLSRKCCNIAKLEADMAESLGLTTDLKNGQNII